MKLRAFLWRAAWSIALTGCATQPLNQGFVPGTTAIAPCTGGRRLLVSNTSREAVRITGGWGVPGAGTGDATEIGRLAPGSEGIFPISAKIRVIWIESLDLPRNANGSYREVQGIQFECVDGSSF